MFPGEVVEDLQALSLRVAERVAAQQVVDVGQRLEVQAVPVDGRAAAEDEAHCLDVREAETALRVYVRGAEVKAQDVCVATWQSTSPSGGARAGAPVV